MTNYAEAVQSLDSWDAVMAAEPDIMFSLIQDVLKIVQSQSDIDRIGRRPAAEAVDYDTLWATLFPKRFSLEPLPVALKELIGDRTQGQFALRVPCKQATLSWLLTGKRNASPQMMVALAAAGGVTAAYFAEWRAFYLSEAITAALLADPASTVAMAKRVALRAS